MKKKSLLLLVAGLSLVGCNLGGNTNSNDSTDNSLSNNDSGTNSSIGESSDSSSSEQEASAFESFKKTYDALGSNYYAIDYLGSIYSDEYDVSVNTMVTTEKGSINLASKSGIALYKNEDNNVRGYRFGIDLEAEDIDKEKMFLPSYSPANFYYTGLFTSDSTLYEVNDSNYEFLYKISDSAEIQETSDAFYKEAGYTKLPRFNTMFTESKDDDGNPTFTTSNIVFTMEVLDKFSFGRFEGYSEVYNSNMVNYFYGSIQTNGLSGAQTVITLIDNSDYYSLAFEVYLSDFSAEYPYITREIIPLSDVPDYEIEDYDLVSYIVPEDFYTNGPGEEPEESVQARQAFKTQLEKLLDSNYTINFTGSSDLFAGAVYTAKVVDDYCFTSGSGTTNYSYYFVDYDVNNKKLGGIYQYSDLNGTGTEESWINTYDYAQAIYNSYKNDTSTNYDISIADDGITITLEGNTINMSDYIQSLYDDTFNTKYMLRDAFNDPYKEAYEGKSFWEIAYGSSWIDQFYYSERTGKFLLSNYYIKSAFLGACIPFANMNESLSIEFLPGTNEDESPIVSASWYYGGFYTFGVVTFDDIGSTKLDYGFGTYINDKYGFSFPVEDAPVEETPTEVVPSTSEEN